MRAIQILGVPIDLGAGRRGVDMGPSAIRYAQLADEIRALGLPCEDLGNISVPLAEQSTTPDNPHLRYLPFVIEAAERVRNSVISVFSDDRMPLILGGDHSLSIGTLAALAQVFKNPAVLWVDAHGDFNTPQTTPSGNIHGMALAVGTGRGAPPLLEIFRSEKFISPSRVALIGVRSLDPGERVLLRESGVHVFTMADIDRRGLQRILDEALNKISAEADALHVSFDMDVIDPDVAPGVGTPVSGGLSYREAHLVMETISESKLLRSLEVVEVNPILDEHNRTARLAVELIASALGRRIF
ncbi:MAG: arginase [Candidatus Bipolaricaulota bacterium]|nr:arginase [Candidatus Bipolaricaulota bacterium]MCS7274921.1 arginase [Candidatus Bipolaricaulota bacterium]MDW8110288.1 arginase [Candidatus Bipolaricaulota bacterium]MDW8329966.1 arginase [Candidatus Bipolaricaulota bacterium]